MAATAIAFSLYTRVEQPWFLLGWVGLVPWLAALDRAGSLGATLGLGLSMSAVFVAAVFSWFATAIAGYAGAPAWIGWVAVLAGGPLLQPQFVSTAIARYVARRRGAGRARMALTGAGAWVATEWLVPKLFADTVGHGFLASVLLRQAADVAGAPGLTLLLVLFNECVLAATHAARAAGSWRAARAPVLCAGALVMAPLGYGAIRLRQFETGEPPLLTAAAVQADLGSYGRMAAELGTYDAVRLILDTHMALSATAVARGDVDLVVWPETVYPTTFGAPKSPDGAAFDREILAFAADTGRAFVFGAYDVEAGHEFNAAFFVAPPVGGHTAITTYRKAALFPLTERVPALLESETLRAWLPWLGTWTAGPGPMVRPIHLRDGRTLRAIPLICYDAVDPGHALAAARTGADLIVTLSNDGWFAGGAGAWLHLVVSAFRSLETRRPQVRATTTGISAVISATGELLATAGTGERVALVASIPRAPATTTLMLAWGDWLGPAALAATIALLALPARRNGPLLPASPGLW